VEVAATIGSQVEARLIESLAAMETMRSSAALEMMKFLAAMAKTSFSAAAAMIVSLVVEVSIRSLGM